jgi:hypothetical protein
MVMTNEDQLEEQQEEQIKFFEKEYDKAAIDIGCYR